MTKGFIYTRLAFLIWFPNLPIVVPEAKEKLIFIDDFWDAMNS